MRYFLCVLCLFSTINLSANEKISFTTNSKKRELIEKSFQQIDSLQYSEKKKISGFKAALYSMVIPGAGQYYAESYWRAALYATLEVTAWTTYFIYNSKGDDKDKQMKTFGDQHWSERKYWSRIYDQAKRENLNPPYFPTLQGDDVDPLLIDFNSDIADQLRYLENELGYSHSLPSSHTQQYYEMIYKYPHQFANGWSDAGFLTPYAPDGSDLPGTAIHFRYLRNLSDEYYDVATTATMAALINHVISALDAALAARSYNKSLNIKFNVKHKYLPYEKVKMYGLQFTW